MVHFLLKEWIQKTQMEHFKEGDTHKWCHPSFSTITFPSQIWRMISNPYFGHTLPPLYEMMLNMEDPTKPKCIIYLGGSILFEIKETQCKMRTCSVVAFTPSIALSNSIWILSSRVQCTSNIIICLWSLNYIQIMYLQLL